MPEVNSRESRAYLSKNIPLAEFMQIVEDGKRNSEEREKRNGARNCGTLHLTAVTGAPQKTTVHADHPRR